VKKIERNMRARAPVQKNRMTYGDFQTKTKKALPA
jgi:hypothetical protein